MSGIIPACVRTARVAHRCDGHPHCGGIGPGEQYEDWRLPPGRDVKTGPHWRKLKVHHPADPPGGGPSGCDLAAAYRENASRDAAALAAWAAVVTACR